MNKRADKVEVAIEDLKDSNVAGRRSGVVLETKASSTARATTPRSRCTRTTCPRSRSRC
jgi:hypothetical protein